MHKTTTRIPAPGIPQRAWVYRPTNAATGAYPLGGNRPSIPAPITRATGQVFHYGHSVTQAEPDHRQHTRLQIMYQPGPATPRQLLRQRRIVAKRRMTTYNPERLPWFSTHAKATEHACLVFLKKWPTQFHLLLHGRSAQPLSPNEVISEGKDVCEQLMAKNPEKAACLLEDLKRLIYQVPSCYNARERWALIRGLTYELGISIREQRQKASQSIRDRQASRAAAAEVTAHWINTKTVSAGSLQDRVNQDIKRLHQYQQLEYRLQTLRPESCPPEALDKLVELLGEIRPEEESAPLVHRHFSTAVKTLARLFRRNPSLFRTLGKVTAIHLFFVLDGYSALSKAVSHLVDRVGQRFRGSQVGMDTPLAGSAQSLAVSSLGSDDTRTQDGNKSYQPSEDWGTA